MNLRCTKESRKYKWLVDITSYKLLYFSNTPASSTSYHLGSYSSLKLPLHQRSLLLKAAIPSSLCRSPTGLTPYELDATSDFPVRKQEYNHEKTTEQGLEDLCKGTTLFLSAGLTIVDSGLVAKTNISHPAFATVKKYLFHLFKH